MNPQREVKARLTTKRWVIGAGQDLEKESWEPHALLLDELAAVVRFCNGVLEEIPACFVINRVDGRVDLPFAELIGMFFLHRFGEF